MAAINFDASLEHFKRFIVALLLHENDSLDVPRFEALRLISRIKEGLGSL
jgi:hypothetical protein